MDEDKGRKPFKRPPSILTKTKPEKMNKSPDRKETTTGILRVDCGKPRRSSGGSVDFRGVPDRLTAQVEPSSPQPSIDRLSVTFAEKSDCSDSSVKINVFDPGSPPSQIQGEMDKVRFCNEHQDDGEEEEDDDYSASVSVILQRRESMKRGSSRRKKRRASSPLPDIDSNIYFPRRRSSEYTNSSGDTAISIENGTTQEQIFENIRLHKEVLSSVKFQPWGMRRKIKLVQQAKAYVKKHEGELQERLAMSKSTKDIWARFNIWLIKELRFLKRELANTMTLLIPWELRIKEIESHFGSAVASYFTFLRWMFWVNLVITVVLACFVAIPEMLTADFKTAGERKEMLPEEKLTATNLVTLWDFGGVLKYSPIFYGYYTNHDGSGTGYRLPFAYFMTGLAVYVYSFVATLRRMAENSRMSKLSEKDDECVFTWKIFTGWDYMIGNAETAHNRVASLILGFKEALLEETERKKDEKNWKVICLRVLISFVVIGLLAFSAYIVFVVVERSTQPEANHSWWRQNETTVSVSIISILFPFCFELLGLLEGYHPRKSLRIQLARIMVLNLLNLYTLIFSQFWKISDMTIELQNLKKNYSLAASPTSSTLETIAPLCILVATNCSTALSTSSSGSEVTNVVSNLPNFNSTPPGIFWNSSTLSTTTSYDNFTSPEVFLNETSSVTASIFSSTTPEEYSRNITDDFMSSSSSSLIDDITAAMGTSDVSTNDSDWKFSSPTIPYLINVLAEMVRYRVPPNNVSIFENLKDMSNDTESFSNETFTSFNESDPFITVTDVGYESKTTSEMSVSVKEIIPTVSTDTFETITPTICYVQKCEERVRVETEEREINFQPVYDMETRKRLRTLCWETMFGQELVKLTVMDLMLTILSVLLLDFFRAIFVRVMNNCWCWDLEKKFPQYGDFKIAENILHLVYNQGMVWMGMFFSPGLPAINLIKLAIMMYLRSWAVLTCNVPHEVVFRASRSNNFYLALLLTMLFLCVLPVGFAIVWIEPSWHCGPFSGYERIYHLFTKTLQKALPKTLHKAFDYIASPGIIIPLLMLLILIIYYLVSLTNSLREANNDLKTQLRRERTEERRKMFQLVNKRARKGSKDETPFAKWKKLLPELAAKQIALTSDLEKGDINENEVNSDTKKELNRKEILTRLMKKALRKSSGTSEEDLHIANDVREPERHDSFFEEKEFNQKGDRNKGRVTEEDKGKAESPKVEGKIKVHKIKSLTSPKSSHREEEKIRVNLHNFPKRNSQPENIPVIKISKIESDEQLITEDFAKEDEKETISPKTKFVAAVDKVIKMRREEKENLSEKLNKKAKQMTDDKKK